MPVVNEGSPSSVSVPPPDMTTGNLCNPGLPKWIKNLPPIPVPGKGKGHIDPVKQIQYHFDQLDAAGNPSGVQVRATLSPNP